ncbi:MAG: hypothetical protein R6V01_05090 [Thermoplasmatota archaeon]
MKEEDRMDARVRTIDTNGGSISLLGTVKGLVSEGDLVEKAAEVTEPDVIALHISIEEIRGLKKVVEGEIKNTYLSSYEKVYARELSRFGEVQIPPPSLVAAYRVSLENNIPLRSLDFNDNKYSDIYTRYIDGMSMVRQSLRQKRVNRKKFKSRSVEDFCLEWDSVVNGLKAYKMLEEKREARMAERIIRLSRKYDRVLAVVELERIQGIFQKVRETIET